MRLHGMPIMTVRCPSQGRIPDICAVRKLVSGPRGIGREAGEDFAQVLPLHSGWTGPCCQVDPHWRSEMVDLASLRKAVAQEIIVDGPVSLNDLSPRTSLPMQGRMPQHLNDLTCVRWPWSDTLSRLVFPMLRLGPCFQALMCMLHLHLSPCACSGPNAR